MTEFEECVTLNQVNSYYPFFRFEILADMEGYYYIRVTFSQVQKIKKTQASHLNV